MTVYIKLSRLPNAIEIQQHHYRKALKKIKDEHAAQIAYYEEVVHELMNRPAPITPEFPMLKQEITRLKKELEYSKRHASGMNKMFRQVGWKQLRKEVLALDFYECTACDAPATHVIYLTKPSQGGIPHIINLTASCEACKRLCEKQQFVRPEERRAYIQARNTPPSTSI